MKEIQYKIYLYGIGDAYHSDYIYIPINPEEVTLTFNGRTETVDIIGLGEALIVKNRELQRVSWSSFFPADNKLVEVVTGINNYIANPDRTSHEIKWHIAQMKPVKLMIVKTDDNGIAAPQLNQEFFITKFTQKDKGGEVGDIYYDIEFTENNQPVITNSTPSGIVNTGNGEATIQTVKDKKQSNKVDFAEGDLVSVSGNVKYIFEAIQSTSNKEYNVLNKTGTIESVDAVNDVYVIKLKAEIMHKITDELLFQFGRLLREEQVLEEIKSINKTFLAEYSDDNRRLYGWSRTKNAAGEYEYTYYYIVYKIKCSRKCLQYPFGFSR